MQPLIPLPCIIIAGGKSSRMGKDKALLPFGGFPTLTQFQLSRLTPYFETIHVSAKSKQKFNFDASFIEDSNTYEESSPLIALLSILEHFDTPVCVLSVDTPFVTISIFQKLFENMDAKTDAIIATSPSCSHQLCAIYAPSLKEKIASALSRNEHKIRTILKESHTKFIPFESDEPFLNINYPHEYEEAKGRV
ncbi:MAG: molybdenum cofactor guanylyltransferase MobA [Sulfurospirillaceae bacterium]|jgi:molybdopterin-guanine dinucleotide biosynthesis protein A|nr:molybdenum cofactor guanylyltransferase MobA [Sulfurospirillaceae bacterium]MDD2826908.1 molybdenum cofactor guanylyltransferase MobA [Sulfurospirillaceae bacterium]